jgi:hypothetical protein
MAKKILIIITIILCIISVSNKATSLSEPLDLSDEINRLVILQRKLNETNSAEDRYYYTTLMIAYINEIKKELEEINKIYYKPALLMSTDEIKHNQKTTK